ncbi:MAG TPA: DMT family transporter [Thermoleophilia bacterium]|nr:DMT family transporter [Thermoleophilia bacterium]
MLGIALALAASVCWGSGDFLGGFSTRRASLWAVIIGSQAVGLAGAALVTLGTGHGWPGLQAVWPVLLGGLASVVAISCFYKALAIGTMSIVAPISATNALIPFAVGIAAGERPATVQLAGVALAAVGVILVAVEPARSGATIGAAGLPGEPAVDPAGAAALFRPGRASGEAALPATATRGHVARPARRDQRRAIALALTAAVCMGLVLVGYDATSRYDPLWAMLGGRLSSAVLFAVVFAVLRPHVKVERSALPLIVAVGILDTGANGLFALATTEGYLSLVGVLGSLYPVVTVLLAFGVLRERIAPHQMAGAAATLAGVALIAAG